MLSPQTIQAGGSLLTLHPSCQSVSQSVETFLILTHAEKGLNLSHLAEVLSKLRSLWIYLPGEEEKPYLMLRAPFPFMWLAGQCHWTPSLSA